MPSSHYNGFSLVELSIVLVILGLLTGGILVGQSLIRVAELRSVTADMSRYLSAFHAFRDRYMAAPGDMTNATQFWGSVTSDGASCPNGLGTGTHTCDGNGNNRLDTSDGVYYEGTRFWQHLANAGLIEGSYTGVVGTSPRFVIGENHPAGKLSNTAFRATAFGGATYGTGYTVVWGPQTNAGIGFFFGYGASATGPALAPQEAWNIDAKLDDGKPDFGTVQGGGENANSACYTAFPSPGDYNLTDSNVLCALTFTLARR
ncbi:prepilin-type N-terminal cleavage/methylation domain-containing protein [Ancylobacter sp. 6x-1]|uniref:Prepilin-type N-terminal cleavage/methylation domain-containing protein n=1 Tax=Ancylobacter crimeensis TaxID=2579147 RepID=A0ABT0DBP0_9HYPH|nr:prepilin-type N-terminal cleavage/methylation domain-containing protein [Ancylobacter crimeensis]MCK0197383.1 prepilin-type N-terminal cleavage/methylation domain-containing protein [Ancylobacter crimeensis]